MIQKNAFDPRRLGGGYVNHGGNMQIYNPTDSPAQHWFIIAEEDLLFYAAFAIRRLFWLRTVLMNAFLFFRFLANALGVTFLVLYRSRMKELSGQNEKL